MWTSRFRTGIFLSVLLHVAGGYALFWLACAKPAIDLNQKVVTVRLSKLGKPRDETLLPRFDASTSPPALSPQRSALSPQRRLGSMDSSLRWNDKTAPKKMAKVENPLDVLKKRFGKPSDEGSKNGSAFGSSLTDELADTYSARVAEIIRQHYSLPLALKSIKKKLTAQIELRIGAHGNVVSVRVVSSSGNMMFDRGVSSVIKRIPSFGAPPLPLRRQYATDGLTIEFSP